MQFLRLSLEGSVEVRLVDLTEVMEKLKLMTTKGWSSYFVLNFVFTLINYKIITHLLAINVGKTLKKQDFCEQATVATNYRTQNQNIRFVSNRLGCTLFTQNCNQTVWLRTCNY